MNAKDLRGQSVAELEAELIKLKKEQFGLRMQHGSGDSGNQNHLHGQTRKDIARVKTVMNEKKKAGES